MSYIQKNIFENLFNIIINVKGKTNDNKKDRMDITLFCYRKNIEFVHDGLRVTKPKTNFVLNKNTQLFF
jgi:hypothetical protein